MDNREMFTIRVYGIVMNGEGEVLVTDEFRLGHRMTKFPGGGLHYGEGTIDCLRREFMEELGQEPLHVKHFYTTDFFQPTALVSPPRQLISIYFTADIPDPKGIRVAKKPFDFEEVEGSQIFRWIPLPELTPDHVTFPVDRKVVSMIRSAATSL